MKIILKQDKYRKARGNSTKLLKLSCKKCGGELFLYQKDGPSGWLKRLYLDRIFDARISTGKNPPKEIKCSHCNNRLASLYIYEKEGRPAYKVIRKTIKRKTIRS